MDDWAIASFRDEYRFLSNFHPSPIKIGGLVYPTVEHAYQAAKTTNKAQHLAISELSTPDRAKKFGSRIEIRPDWEKVKLKFMSQLIHMKFQDNNLKEMLQMTGKSELIEGNEWCDLYWGMCRCEKHSFTGSNYLGRLLMRERTIK